MPRGDYAVLATVSHSCSEPLGRFPHVTHPCATKSEDFVRLACVKHAASVRSEPGSNSQVLEKLSKLSYLNPTQTCIHHTECVVVNYHHLPIPLLFNFQTATTIKKNIDNR